MRVRASGGDVTRAPVEALQVSGEVTVLGVAGAFALTGVGTEDEALTGV